ncbi:hypothetical protein XACJM35_1040002 [Xanthomonas citri pv. citri]|nr:hypothetical protein XAC902_440002 [Xanthomonas citri pv. citri]CEE74644.1 hypothetical protein XAC3608_730014 [Xanthomonas citri pv. citri]CEH48373.1 hypothetical protein XACLG97_4460002 [Xanthomonas citri pv. citri]CEH50589.1 hypothetical protein XACG102_4350002 [Xanthomonas citri pv. citri]CEH66601.1 hypothetical protein XAC3612_1070002 [Xanthomonas citri pv. citri]
MFRGYTNDGVIYSFSRLKERVMSKKAFCQHYGDPELVSSPVNECFVVG